MTPAKDSLRIAIVEKPSELPPGQCAELIEAFAELAYRTTGKTSAGQEWDSYRPAIDGWRRYYNALGARPQDYERLVLIYDLDVLVHFTGITGFVLESGHRFIFIRTAMTLGSHHGSGLLKRAIGAIFSPAWLRELGEVWFVLRTANPIVYEATRTLAREYAMLSGVGLTLYPHIDDSAQMQKPLDAVRGIAIEVARRISPGCEFEVDTFVTRGYFKEYGPLYREPVFPCRNPATQEYFQRVLDYTNQDGIVILIHLQPQPKE